MTDTGFDLPMALIGELMDGPLDIVGDVHGEIDALRELLAALGYDKQGQHRQGRRLVFVGDLCDRGPDSIAVLELVGEWVDRQRAQCVLGNHELNLLSGARKDGNGWYFDDDHDRHEGRFTTSRQASPASRPWIDAFIASLPVALHHAGLRIVHACWDGAAVQRVAASGERSVRSLYAAFERQSAEALRSTMAAGEEEERRYHDMLLDPRAEVPFLHALARKSEAHQMSNPVRILTSGAERPARAPFFSGGKWRMVDRAAWWDDYSDEVPVVIGHYWRWPVPGDRPPAGFSGADLFVDTAVAQGLGPRANVHCVDYSVGRRFQERLLGVPFQTRLAALRWPEQVVAFEDGAVIRVT